MNHLRGGVFFFILAMALAIPSGSTLAQEQTETGGSALFGDTFISLTVGAQYLNRDVVNGFGLNETNGAPLVAATNLDTGFNIDDWGGFAELSVFVPHYSDHFGTNSLFFVLDGNLLNADANRLFGTAGGANNILIPFIDGNNAGAGRDTQIANSGEQVTSSTDVDNGGFGAFIGLASLPFPEPTFDKYGKTETASEHKGSYGFGLYGAFDQLQIEATFANITTPGPLSVIEEEVETFSFGPRAFAKRSFELSPGVELFGTGSLAVLFSRGELDGRQRTVGVLTTASASVSDVEEDIAFLANLRTGINFSHNPKFLFTLFGEVEWRNDAYEIINPTFPAGAALNANVQPARLEQTDIFSLILGAQIRIIF
ncbi:MAG: hypothetical protein AAGD23_10325 [Pseudomonadota bacterium]